MKKFFSFILTFGLLTGLARAGSLASEKSEKSPEQITIGVIPGGNPDVLRAQALEMAKALQTELGIPVNIYISKNYAGLVEAMKTKKIDFAFFSSMTYVFAEKETQTKVLLKKVWEGPFYYSALVARKDAKIKKVEQLKGKRVAFVDENSSSGYLYPQVMLKKKNIDSTRDFKETIFSGNHQASIRLLEEAKVDAAAVFSDNAEGSRGAWIKFASDKKAKYNVLWVSEPIPSDPFCVRQDFYDKYPKVTHTLMFALIDMMAASKDNRQYSEVLGSQDLMPATSKQYDPVREMVQALKIELH